MPLYSSTEIEDFRGSGAHGRIRTFGRFLTGGFLDRCHRPLGHMSIWRRERDLNSQARSDLAPATIMVKLIVSVVLPRDWVATSCHTVRRPLHNAPFSHRCLYDPWQTRTADSSLRGWRLRPTCRRGLMVCRVGFEPTNCNRPVLQTVCFDRLHTGTYKEALSLVVLPAGFEPAARGSSDHCSTC